MKNLRFLFLFIFIIGCPVVTSAQNSYFNNKPSALYYLSNINFKPIAFVPHGYDENGEPKYWKYTFSFSLLEGTRNDYRIDITKQSIYKDGSWIYEEGNVMSSAPCTDIHKVEINKDGDIQVIMNTSYKSFRDEVVWYQSTQIVVTSLHDFNEYAVPILIDYSNINKEKMVAAISMLMQANT